MILLGLSILAACAFLSLGLAQAGLTVSAAQVGETETQPFGTPSTQIGATQIMSGTATLLPLPSITFQYPEITATPRLLSSVRQPTSPDLSKTQPRTIWQVIIRFLPLAVLLVIWLGLIVWFILSQRENGS